jgi:alginate production protein
MFLMPLISGLGLVSGLLPMEAQAGAPEYLQLHAEPGMALEIAGFWDPKIRIFIADDMEILPQERLPKLRGEIQEIGKKDSTIVIFGMPVRVYERTEFIQDGGASVNFGSLKKGMRIEVSCKFDEDGSWKARKIKTNDVKKSDKIKGTLTRVAIDGNAPDTLEMSGFLILLVNETDIVDPTGSLRQIEKELFPDIKMADMYSPSDGLPLVRGLQLNADYRQSIRSENEYDLSKAFATDKQATEPAVRLELTAFLNERIQAFAQARVRKRYYISSDQSNLPGDEFNADFTQLYLLMRNIGVKGLAFQIGRQDFDDDREWLYDDYLDALRVYYYGIKPLAFEAAYIHAVSPLKSGIDTWTDLLFQLHAYPNKDNHISSYLMMRSDTAVRNREPKWYGIRYKGKVAGLVSPWFELSRMVGEDKGRDLKSNAFDIGATFSKSNIRFQPSMTFGYAYGSGDKVSGDATDNRFRQTGYEDNVDYLGGVALVHYYSEVLDPELSNIAIMTVGIGARITTQSSIDLIYHTFKQDIPRDEFVGSNLVDPPARPNGISDDLGSEVDIVLGINNLWNHVSLSWAIGSFNPGEAFDPFLNDALLNRLNLSIKL